MKTAILYASSHGTTRKVVKQVLSRLDHLRPEVFQVRRGMDPSLVLDFDLLLFFCPTYGDEELQEDMEHFLMCLDVDLAGRRFAVCELGAYYGYDDFSFGAMPILRRRLLELNGQELCEPLSLDSLPCLPHEHLERWVSYLNETIIATAPCLTAHS
jgi:flavodoxin